MNQISWRKYVNWYKEYTKAQMVKLVEKTKFLSNRISIFVQYECITGSWNIDIYSKYKITFGKVG